MRYKLPIFIAVAACLLAAGCAKNDKAAGGPAATGTPKGDVSNDICAYFTPDFVYSATGKTIVRMEPSPIAGVFACDYFTDYKEDYYKDVNFSAPGGPHISIVLDNLNVERNKEGVKYMGASIETDPRIKMEHYIVRRSNDKSIWSIDLVINPDRFVWTDVTGKAITDDELIAFGAKMAELIQGKLSFKIEKNPVDLTPPRVDTTATQKQTVQTFLENIGNGKISEALDMMDANDNTKAGWWQNFNTLESLKIKSLEPNMQEEWTNDRQLYKAILDVKLKSGEGGLGWENGENYRWVSVQKTGDKWFIHELANNP